MAGEHFALKIILAGEGFALREEPTGCGGGATPAWD
jgi:hypothetical protein